MLIGGTTIFLLTYLPSSIIGATAIDKARKQGPDNPLTLDIDESAPDRRKVKWGRRMMVPLVGPFAAMPVTKSVETRWILALSGAAQLTSAALVIAGAVRANRYAQAKRWGWAAAPTRGGAEMAVHVKF